MQRAGGIAGWVLYGLFIGLIFGAVYALTRPRFDGVGLALNGLLRRKSSQIGAGLVRPRSSGEHCRMATPRRYEIP